jgi:hypothetical protein
VPTPKPMPPRRAELEDSGRRRALEGRAQASRSARSPERTRGASEPHPLWSGAWPRIWILSAIAILSLLVMNLLVRSDW